jgi:hypothetical protein
MVTHQQQMRHLPYIAVCVIKVLFGGRAAIGLQRPLAQAIALLCRLDEAGFVISIAPRPVDAAYMIRHQDLSTTFARERRCGRENMRTGASYR